MHLDPFPAFQAKTATITFSQESQKRRDSILSVQDKNKASGRGESGGVAAMSGRRLEPEAKDDRRRHSGAGARLKS